MFYKSVTKFSAVIDAVGSYSPGNRKSEKFENGNWTDIEESPVALSHYAVVFSADSFYYFGGYRRST